MMSWIGAPNEQTLPAFSAFRTLALQGMVPIGTEPGHRDGWGLSAYHPSEPTICASYREEIGADESEQFLTRVRETHEAKSSLVIAHLRKASPGMAITLENVHPYQHEHYSFCHNGLVEDLTHPHLQLNTRYQSLRKGTNDSEQLFYRLLQEKEETGQGSIPEAFRSFVSRLRALRYRSFTTLFSDGEALYICREVNESDPLLQAAPHLVDGYYSFFLGYDPERTYALGCSETLPLQNIQWELIPNHTLVMISRSSLEEQRFSLLSPTSSSAA